MPDLVTFNLKDTLWRELMFLTAMVPAEAAKWTSLHCSPA
uniref:Uncharacterized protein n=1 Tax=Siphoviridae sp. ctr8v12 TaxID=2825685 RepID=A0A8S5QGU4_9CAUD|nr:MAG TPA: hypothetical protein [Siphoviridae sp. ctr8v12]